MCRCRQGTFVTLTFVRGSGVGHRGATKSFRFSYNLLRQWILVLVTADLRCSVELMRGTAEFIALAEECHALQQLSQACARFKSRSLIGAERSKEIFRRYVSIVARVPNSPDSDFALLRRAVQTVVRVEASCYCCCARPAVDEAFVAASGGG